MRPSPVTKPALTTASEEPTGWPIAQARRVFVRELEVEAFIGVYAHEHRAPQPVIVSLDLQVIPHRTGARVVFTPPPRPGDNAARDIVCYDKLSQMVRALAKAGHIDYVETLAEEIAERALEDERIIEISVTVEKPQAIGGALSAGVEILRRR
ncbi:MAG: dihydroneopterin aldolase [Neomegalonema sp.]|nr:dihydroneopterin aldolase [Neomegalonema sp.]